MASGRADDTRRRRKIRRRITWRQRQQQQNKKQAQLNTVKALGTKCQPEKGFDGGIKRISSGKKYNDRVYTYPRYGVDLLLLQPNQPTDDTIFEIFIPTFAHAV